MVESDPEKPALRIVRGSASEEELAAVTVVLCSVLAQAGAEGEEESPEAPLWQPERSTAVYRSPYSWR
ncbi:acyl-CoA carboxylase subunit epsilon [Streptomyces sp. NPDC101118]|uniref:acyl-CoA carboxylase subunit epsilon n=1 Tax=Streptomyces sp. NPDC101118 TaxID=3366109 RepID=UPI00382CBA63